MNFLLSANDHYILPVVVCITSILENHKEEDVNIYILESDFTKKNKNILLDLSNKYKKRIHIIHIDEEYYSTVPALRWTKETYYRLLINEVLPNNLERILYLDCDIIVDKNIIDLYNLDLGDKYIAALSLFGDFRKNIGLDRNGKYFQAGVLLFDLNKCRSVINYEKSLKIIKDLGNKMIAVDQDILNVAFDGKIKEINEKYNNCRITSFNGDNLHRIFNYVDQKDIDHTYIFHYAAGKPWNNLFSGSCENIWYKYLLLSSYSNLYKEKFNKLKYKILRFGFIKYLLFLYTYVTPFINKTFKILLSKKTFIFLKSFYRKYVK